METNYNTINVKDLPSLEQILNGDFLIVENINGTNRLDFADFVIGPSNTSFYTSVANDIRSVSAKNIKLDTDIKSVSSTVAKEISTLNDSVTSTVELFSPNNLYFGAQKVLMASGDFENDVSFVDVGNTISKSNFNVEFEGFYSGGTLQPDQGFNTKFNWWYERNQFNNSTVTVYISTDGNNGGNDREFSVQLFYFNQTA